MPETPNIDAMRSRIATLTAQQQTAAAEAERSEAVLKEQGWNPAAETAEQFVARLKQREQELAAEAATALQELDTLVSKYEDGGDTP